ncbi:hypothetical protein GCM10010106_40790 [Thermopolyspora flexuosa]|nr:hypothetical protein GCM10010106_40790 [Thermopolyspora flexuosa]
MDRGGGHDERGQQLLEHVAVAVEQQAAELGEVVGDQIDLHAVAVPRPGDRLLADVEAEDLLGREQVRAAQVDVGVGGREAVQVGAARGGGRAPSRGPAGPRIASYGGLWWFTVRLRDRLSAYGGLP